MNSFSALSVWIIVLILSIIRIDYAQGKNVPHTFSSESLELRITAVKSILRIGEIITITVSLKNKSSYAIDLPYDQLDLLAGYEVSILDSKGNALKQTKNPMASQAISRRMSWMTLPTKEDKRALVLSNFYEFKAETYLITASRNVKNATTGVELVAKSKPLKITIIN